MFLVLDSPSREDEDTKWVVFDGANVNGVSYASSQVRISCLITVSRGGGSEILVLC